MKNMLIALMLTLPLSAFAADEKKAEDKKAEDKAPTAQQGKMKSCNDDANGKSLKGEERKAFMKTCLSNKPAATATQQDKMKTCNAEAKTKDLKGDARKDFMKECLSNK